jgi:hypothetical protein
MTLVTLIKKVSQMLILLVSRERLRREMVMMVVAQTRVKTRTSNHLRKAVTLQKSK